MNQSALPLPGMKEAVMPRHGFVLSSLTDDEMLRYVEDIDHPEVKELMKRLENALQAVREAEANAEEEEKRADELYRDLDNARTALDKIEDIAIEGDGEQDLDSVENALHRIQKIASEAAQP